MTEPVFITARHCKRLGFCVSGQREWFRLHGLDFRDFVKNGIAYHEIEHIDDANMQAAYELARKEAADGRRR